MTTSRQYKKQQAEKVSVEERVPKLETKVKELQEENATMARILDELTVKEVEEVQDEEVKPPSLDDLIAPKPKPPTRSTTKKV